MSVSRRAAALASILLVALVCAAVLLAISIAFYPGGTWMDPESPGFDPLRNFFSDLLAPTALNGAPNPAGAMSATAGLLVLAVAAALSCWIVPGLFATQRRLGLLVRAAGLVALVGMLAVPLTPTPRFGLLHAIAIMLAALPALLAAAAATLGLLRELGPTRYLTILGIATFVTALCDAVLYVHFLLYGGASAILVPVLQRVALASFFAWSVGVALAVRRLRRGPFD